MMKFFECYPDEALLRELGLNSSELKGGHSFGRSRVCAKLARSTNSLGLVDEDPGSAKDPYLSNLFKLQPFYKDTNVILIEDPKTGNRLAVIRPNLESLVVKIANEKKLDLQKNYALANQPKLLHEFFSPKNNINERKKLRKFINDVSDHKSIAKLKDFL